MRSCKSFTLKLRVKLSQTAAQGRYILMLELDTTQKVLSFGPEIEARSDLLLCLKIDIRKELKI